MERIPVNLANAKKLSVGMFYYSDNTASTEFDGTAVSVITGVHPDGILVDTAQEIIVPRATAEETLRNFDGLPREQKIPTPLWLLEGIAQKRDILNVALEKLGQKPWWDAYLYWGWNENGDLVPFSLISGKAFEPTCHDDIVLRPQRLIVFKN